MTDTQTRTVNDPRLGDSGIVDLEPRMLIDGEWIRAEGGARAASSFSRVSGVRRSWLTEAKSTVRWSI